MNKGKRIGRIMLCLVVSLMMVMTMIPRTSMDLAYADVGETPAHDKSVDSNGDGTYTIELSVTGDADTEVETAANVNVLVIYDESSSMTSNNVSTNPNRNRADYAEDIMHDFIANLRQYQKSDDPTTTDKDESDNIQVALVGFGPNATTRQGWTSNLGDTGQGINRFFDDGVDGTVTSSHNYTSNNGTNWQAATAEALDVLDDADTDPTFVIFVTDGAPTAAAGETTINPGGNHQWTDFRVYYRAATTNAYNIQSDDNVTMFGIYAYGREADLLDDLIYYSNNGSHRVEGGYNINTCTAQQHDFGATEATDNYYNAADTAALTAAIEDIFQTIVEALGVAQVAISDGTTNQVKVGTDVAELLEVDESSYEYWLSIPVDNNNQFQRIDLVSGEPVTYTVSADGKTVTWPGGSVTVNGTLSGGKLKYEWTEANALYNVAPPEAHLVNGAVDWDLKDAGTLLDGVTYSVTFRCYPSQTTLDYVADIRNDPYVSESNPGAWGDLPPEIQQYIDKNGNLLTNTTTKLSWIDTREDNPQEHNDVFPEQDPVPNDAVEELAVSKDWKNLLEGEWEKPTGITLNVTRDDDPCYTVTLNNGNDWKSNVFISIGIMGADGQPLEGAEGHDFTFTEPTIQGASYKWEIDVPTVHPMLINNVMTMLVKVDEDHPLPADIDESDVYEFNDATYYVDEASVALTATNERRSSLNLTKVVEGVDAPADAKFPFSVTVENSLAPDTAPSEQEDPGHDSDYWVWFSVWDENQQAVTEGVEGATHAGATSSWYYAPSGTTVTIPAGDGYSIRFNNLPTDTTYTITEGTLPTGFTFESAEIEVTQGTGEIGEDTFTGGVTSEGTIEVTNTLYQVTYTNKYELIDINVDKVWADENDQDGMRPDELELTLNGLPAGTTAPEPEIVESEDGNTWTYTWKAVPRYDASGNEIAYTVTEGTVPDGYTCETTTVNDGGTITNTHEPEVTDLSVEKVWDDDDNRDALRPTSVSVQLKADGTAKGDPVTLNESNEWSYTWSNLPKNNAGKAIEYTVEEAAVENYTTSYELDEETRTYTITNSYTPEVTSYTFNKSWDDNDNQDGVRPATISAQLYADGTAYGDPVTIDAQGQWSYTWSNLPKNSAGTAITYTAKELNASGTAVEDNGALDDNYTATYSTTTTSTTVTNTHSVEKTQYTVTKTWNDANNQDGIRPTSVSVQLLADGTAKGDPVTLDASNSWTYTWENLDKKSNGNVIDYSVAEITAIEGYTTVGPTEAEDGLSATIENTHETAKSNYTVNKTWVDADDQDGLRPSSIQVQLYADGVAEGDAVTVSKNEDGTWSYTWTDLPVNKAGTAITYTAKELDANGAAVENGGAYNDDYTATYSTTDTSTTVTNTHETLKTYYTITKTWDDANDQDGVRPSSVQAQLYADGVAEGDAVTVSKNEDGTWSYTWNDLPVNKAGTAITYTAKELDATGAAVENGGAYNSDYTATYSTTATSTTVTNTHTPAEIKIIVSKIWEDENDQDGVRPSSVTVNLLANGQAAPREAGDATVQLSASNSWQYTWDKLPEYAAGEKITYSLTEDTVTGYNTDISALTETDEEGVYEAEITNTHEVYKTTVTVTKVWEDEDDKDGLRPESINVQLMADGAASGDPVELSDENEWTYTWEDLDVNKAGKAITYKVDEPEETEGYETEVGKVTGSAEDGFEVEITNTHEVYKTSVVVSKVWDDADDKDGVRPDSVTIRLLADGEEFKTAELNEANKWAYAWVNLDVNKAGKAITYTVEEDDVEDYEATVGKLTGNADDGYKVKITNYHKAKPDAVMIDPPVQKVVKGNPSKDETFTFQMKAITEGAPMPEGAKDGVMTMDITGSGEKEFGEAWIEEPGTYVYEITEVDTKAANYKYDSTVYTLTVDVVEEADGTQSKLVKTETIKGGDGKIVFTNTYEEPPAPPTGDTTVVVPYIVIGISALILLLMLLFRTRKNRA